MRKVIQTLALPTMFLMFQGLNSCKTEIDPFVNYLAEYHKISNDAVSGCYFIVPKYSCPSCKVNLSAFQKPDFCKDYLLITSDPELYAGRSKEMLFDKEDELGNYKFGNQGMLAIMVKNGVVVNEKKVGINDLKEKYKN